MDIKNTENLIALGLATPCVTHHTLGWVFQWNVQNSLYAYYHRNKMWSQYFRCVCKFSCVVLFVHAWTASFLSVRVSIHWLWREVHSIFKTDMVTTLFMHVHKRMQSGAKLSKRQFACFEIQNAIVLWSFLSRFCWQLGIFVWHTDTLWILFCSTKVKRVKHSHNILTELCSVWSVYDFKCKLHGQVPASSFCVSQCSLGRQWAFSDLSVFSFLSLASLCNEETVLSLNTNTFDCTEALVQLVHVFKTCSHFVIRSHKSFEPLA